MDTTERLQADGSNRLITNDWLPGDGHRKINIGPRALGAPRAARAQRGERERERERERGRGTTRRVAPSSTSRLPSRMLCSASHTLLQACANVATNRAWSRFKGFSSTFPVFGSSFRKLRNQTSLSPRKTTKCARFCFQKLSVRPRT